MASLSRWQRVWQEIGAATADRGVFDQLVACYGEPHRKYHTMQHLNECFDHLDTLRTIAERPAEVEIALWFHDVIYKTSNKDNEEKSAQWAYDSALHAGLAEDIASRLHSLVMVTKHNATPVGRDAEVLIDIDLGILGSDEARFDEYEQQVREEYSWVPGPLYRRERRRILQEFANRPLLYYTAHFRQVYEKQARNNLARSLALL